jgi:hypothetical protein
MAYTPTPEDNETIANLPGDIRAVNTKVDNHTGANAAAHAASAISYGSGTVETALNTAAGHEANQNNPHGVTAEQAGAVALADAVTTVTANKVVKRDANGKVAGDITGNAASIANGGHTITPSWDGTEVKFQVDSTTDVPVYNSMLVQGMSPTQLVNQTMSQTAAYTGSQQTAGVDNTAYWSTTAISTATNSNLAPFPITPEVNDGGTLSTSTNTTSSPTYYMNWRKLYTVTGNNIPAGSYSLSQILQKLINNSHKHVVHGVQGYTTYTNCNCDCSFCSPP